MAEAEHEDGPVVLDDEEYESESSNSPSVSEIVEPSQRSSIRGFKDIAVALGAKTKSAKEKEQTKKEEEEEDEDAAVDTNLRDESAKASGRKKKGSKVKVGDDEKDGVSGKDFKNHFTPNIKFDTNKAAPSHICTLCTRELSLTVVNEQGKTLRTQWQNAKSHIASCHKEAYNSVVAAKMKSTEADKKKFRDEQSRIERDRLLAMSSSLVVTKNSQSVIDILNDDSNEEQNIKPIFAIPKLDRFNEIQAHMILAYQAAKDNLSLNHFEKDGYRFAATLLGLDAIMPVAETIKSSQEFLVKFLLEGQKRKIAAITDASPLPVVSIQTDIWSDHAGAQQMGVRLTALNLVNFEWVTIILPLESAEEIKLDSFHEAELVERGLDRLNLRPGLIYSQTTDTASVAVLGAVRNHIVHVPCKSHMLALAFKDVMKVPDAKSYDLEKDDDLLLTDIRNNQALLHLRGVSARAAHFGRSASACRALNEWQSSNKKTVKNFIQWSPTRWLGIFNALARDTAILNDGGDKFIEKYVKQIEKTSPKVAVKIAVDSHSARSGILLLSIMKPFNDLTLALQRDDITLGEAHLLILTTCNELYRPTITVVDSSGMETKETLVVSHLNESFAALRKDLCARMFSRLIDDNLDDETIVNLALDPKLFACVSALPRISAHDDIIKSVSECLMRLKDYGETVIVSRMLKVLKAIISLEKEKNGEMNDNNRSREDDKSKEDDKTKEDDRASTEEPEELSHNKGQEEEEPTMNRLLRMIESADKEVLSGPASNDVEMMEAQMKNEYQRFVVARGKSPKMTGMAFWKTKAIEYPHLCHVFLQSQSARPSSSRLESVFSVASGAVPVQRESLSIESLNNILFLKFAKVTKAVIRGAAMRKLEEEKQNNQKGPKRLRQAPTDVVEV